jgi:hypothetical protein
MKSVLLLLVVACTGAHRDHSTDGGDPPVDGSTVTPSNADAFGSLSSNGMIVAPPNGTFDTSADCMAPSALGNCTVVTRAGLRGACVCRADTITIGDLTVTGPNALVLLADKQVTVTGTLDASGTLDVPGPGATAGYTAKATGLTAGTGGSFASVGGGKHPRASFGTATLVPLLGGTSGQSSSGTGVGGGGGGGAVQITAGIQIEIDGTVNAGGGGGKGGAPDAANAGGGGGGAGGGILLEAPTVIVSGTVVANGGGGGGGGGNGYGGDGDEAGQAAAFASRMVDPTTLASGGNGSPGGGCPLYGYVWGGPGGAGALGMTAANDGVGSSVNAQCIGPTAFGGAGGGGGGVGRIRINTTHGCQCGGTMIPTASFGSMARQ